MSNVKLKAESDSLAVDQTIHEIELTWKNKDNWYGRPISNPNCPILTFPKYAWKEV